VVGSTMQCIKIKETSLDKKERIAIQVVGINIPFRSPSQELISSRIHLISEAQRVSCLENTQ
jgi:hypothetical protein